jgi:gas vesicle protein
MELDQQDSERSVMLSVLAGIGVGVLVGAIAGLLLAPKPGRETREDISHTLSDLGNKISDLSQQVATRVKTAVETGKQAVTDRMERAGSDESIGASV